MTYVMQNARFDDDTNTMLVDVLDESQVQFWLNGELLATKAPLNGTCVAHEYPALKQGALIGVVLISRPGRQGSVQIWSQARQGPPQG